MSLTGTGKVAPCHLTGALGVWDLGPSTSSSPVDPRRFWLATRERARSPLRSEPAQFEAKQLNAELAGLGSLAIASLCSRGRETLSRSP